MRLTITILSALFLFAAIPAIADDFEADDDGYPPLQDEILLSDGTLLLGTIVEEREDVVIFETEALGRMEIPRANIKNLAHGSERFGALTDPDFNSLMICPTPATLGGGDTYFRSFELFILNFGTSITETFDLSIGTLFPVSSSVLMVSLGGKLQLADRETSPIGLALTGSFTKLEDLQFGNVGAVAGIGNKRNSLNLAVSRTFDDDGDNDTLFLVGGDVQFGRRSKVFGEYMGTAEMFEKESDDINGFINIGLRFFGETHSFSLSGFRPLSIEDSGSFIAFPMIMYSYHF